MFPEGCLFRLLGSNRLFGGLMELIIPMITQKTHDKGKLLEELTFRWMRIKMK
jgi:hypothetical protein